jgi:hypothetical protein
MECQNPAETLARRTRHLAEGWLNRLIDRLGEEPPPPHRQPCLLCPASGLLPALGPFGALPHHLVHPLVRAVTDLVDDEDQERLDAAQRRLREQWQDGGRVESHDDGLAVAAALHQAAVAEVRAAVEAFTTEHADVAERILRSMASALEREVANTGWLIDPRTRRGLSDTIRETIEDWCVWLSSGDWDDAEPIPPGTRCSICAALGLDGVGVHGAAHELSRAIEQVELQFLERFASPRIEPPGHGALQEVRAELRSFVIAALFSARLVIGNAMVAYVLPHVDGWVHEATRWIDTGDDGSLG